MSGRKDTSMCRGCRNDFYNGNNSIGVSECWSLKGAQVVKRWRQGWWTQTDAPGTLVQVKTYDCHHETGSYAFLKELPSCAIEPVYLERKKKISAP